MHELGIVFHIIRSVERVCEQNHISQVSAVTLELGQVSGVIPHYLYDAWKWAAAKHEVTASAELKVEEIVALTLCEDCQTTYPTLEHGKTCPTCGSTHTYLLCGQEVLIKEIETPEPESVETGALEPAPTEKNHAHTSSTSAAMPDAVEAAHPLNIAELHAALVASIEKNVAVAWYD